MPGVLAADVDSKPLVPSNGDTDQGDRSCSNGGLKHEEEADVVGSANECPVINSHPVGESDKQSDIEEPASITDNESKELPADKASEHFRLHLVLPGVPKPVDIMLTARDAVHDLLQFSLESPDSCYRSCLSVQHKGRRLDEFIEIGSVEGLVSGDTIELVEEPYSQRDARLHVQRLKDLVMADPLGGTTSPEGLSLSFLSSLARGEEAGDAPASPSDLSANGSGLAPISQFYPESLLLKNKRQECLKSLSYSHWNPPTNKRMMKGDLLYLDVTTLEGAWFGITACPSGWFLNKSTPEGVFNPTARKTHHHKRHLVHLLSQISPLFKKGFSVLRKSGDSTHLLESLPVPYPVVTWVGPHEEPHPPVFRLDEGAGLKPPGDEQVLGQVRDWNEEFQTARELPADTLPAKIFRERILFKVHTEFVSACMKAAMAALDGNLQTLNPSDEFKHRLFLWNNIFLSLAFDGRDHYKDYGGDAAVHAAVGADLNGVAAFERRDQRGLSTLGTVLVDYRGCRVVCQSVIPGLLGQDQESSVVYGSIDAGRNIKTDPQFVVLLRAAADDFHIRPHKLYSDESGSDVVELPSSHEVKGIVGNDKRLYALDLFRLHPPDHNYQTSTRHKMAVLRPELVETYHSVKFLEFLSLVKSRTLEINAAKQEATPTEKHEPPPVASTEDKPQVPSEGESPANKGNSPHSQEIKLLLSELESGKEPEKEFSPLLPHDQKVLSCDSQPVLKDLQELPEVAGVVKTALQEVGSTSDDSFQLKYNVDCLSPIARHAESPEALEADRSLVQAASGFLVDTMIPQFLQDCIMLSATPLDGHALKQTMHSRGINMRYLGAVARSSKREDLAHIERLAVSEMISRVARIKFRKLLQDCSLASSHDLIIHFLNVYLGGTTNHTPQEEVNKKTKKKKVSLVKNGNFPQLGSEKLWSEITAEISTYYQYEINHTSLKDLCSQFGIQKVSLLREFTRKTGIRLLLQDYDFESSPVFSGDDLLGMWPLVKHTDFQSVEVMALMELAHSKLSSGKLLLALELYKEAIQISIQVYGPMHVDIANCYRQAAKVCQLLGDWANALDNQEKATVILERVLGVDHPDTVVAIVNLALYSHNIGNTSSALRLLYRARYYIVLLHGEDHPEMATCDSNIAAVLLSNKDFSNSLYYFQSTLRLFKKYYGAESLQTALTYHLMARVYSFMGNFREALLCEKTTHAIYSSKFGRENTRTQESYSYVRELTDMAVTMQRTINEIVSTKGASGKISPGSHDEEQDAKQQGKKQHVVRRKKRGKAE